MMDDAYTRAYLALCNAEDADAAAYRGYLDAPYGTPDHDAAFAAWWPLREARDRAAIALTLQVLTIGELRQDSLLADARCWLAWRAVVPGGWQPGNEGRFDAYVQACQVAEQAAGRLWLATGGQEGIAP